MKPKKSDIRSRLLEMREQLGKGEVRQAGEAVTQRLTRTDFYQRANCLSCYVSVKNEVNTHTLIRLAIDDGKRVAVPVLTSQKGQMIHREVDSLENLEPNPLGLLEPPEGAGAHVLPEAFDLIVVPVVAFDRRGYRIGFGGGYYDRFLARCSALKVGLAYDFQCLDEVPSGPHDQRLDRILTETVTYTCTDP